MVIALRKDVDLEYLFLDSMIACSPAFRGRPRKAGCQEIGRSRGGLTINLHAAVDALGNPLRVILTLGQIADIDQAEALIKDHPVNFVGAPILGGMLTRDGIQIGRKYVGTLMGKIEIAAIYRKCNTRAPQPKHPADPYLRKNLTIDWPNRIWATDLT